MSTILKWAGNKTAIMSELKKTPSCWPATG
ncbi:DNA adenine methylase [Escherichia coli]|nr:DNA adenine methylase [Escherichia coli]